MLKRISALAALAAAASFHWFWEFVRSLFYERGSHMLNPLIANVSPDQMLQLGISGALVSVGAYLFWKTRPPRPPVSPLEIFFDPANPLNRYWSLENQRDAEGRPQGAFWQWRALIRNTSARTARNVRVTVEAIGAMPTRPELSVFDLNKQTVIDLPPRGESLVTIRTWLQPRIRVGFAIGPSIYGPVKMIASADDVPPTIKYFEFDYMQEPAMWEVSPPVSGTAIQTKDRQQKTPFTPGDVAPPAQLPFIWDKHLGHTYSGQGTSMITEAFQIGVLNNLGHEFRLERAYAISAQGAGERSLQVATDKDWVEAHRTLPIAAGQRILFRISFGQTLSRDVFENWKAFQITIVYNGSLISRHDVTEQMVKNVYTNFAPSPIGPIVRAKD